MGAGPDVGIWARSSCQPRLADVISELVFQTTFVISYSQRSAVDAIKQGIQARPLSTLGSSQKSANI